LTGCSQKEEGIWIGVISPTTGGQAFYGNDILNSFRLAVEEINAAGGVSVGGEMLKMHLFHADDAGDPTTAPTAASRIISHGVDFIAGGYASGVVNSILQQIADENLLFLVANANSSAITRAGHQQTFMINGSARNQVAKLQDLVTHLGARNIALIHQGCSFTEDLSNIASDVLPAAGFNIVTTQVLPDGETAVASTIATAIIAAGADFVYWCGYHADGSNVIRQLRQGGYEGHIAVGDGSASDELIEASGPAGEGVYVTCSPFAQFTEGGEDFIANFNAKFGEDPGTAYATLAYDTLFLLKAAIEKADSFEFEKVRDTVQNIEFKGLSGLIKFTADRELAESNFIILQIQDGVFAKANP
jgi:ABC-type branched-subunit amino acid transport system substrate-binding protein